MLSHSMSISFDQLPEYFRQLLKAVRHEGEYGERYFINVLAQNTPGLAARIELLITMRQAGYVVQNKRLCLPFTLASDADFKEHLIGCFDKIKKEKEQLRRSVALLETQLREERLRSRELEDKNRWLQKELEFSQGLLRSAENIQKHYESLLHQKHRGEIGGSVLVKIEDSIVGGEALSTGVTTSISSLHSSQPLALGSRSASIDKDITSQQVGASEDDVNGGADDGHITNRTSVLSIMEDNTIAISAAGDDNCSNEISASGGVADCDLAGRQSPSIDTSTPATASALTISSLATITTSPCDKKTLKGAAKRKASFHNYSGNQNGGSGGSSTSTTSNAATAGCNTTTATTSATTTANETDGKANEQTQRPPPRKYAAAMVQVDSQLIKIRREQEQQQRKTEDEEDAAEDAKTVRFSSSNSIVETPAIATSPLPPPPPALTVTSPEQGPIGQTDTPMEKEHRSPLMANMPPRPFSHPTVLVPPSSSQQHQSAFTAPPPPPFPASPAVQASMPTPSPGHLPSHFQSSWHLMSNSPSLPVMSSLHIPVAAAAAAAFSHHDFVGLGVSPYLLPTINSVTGGVVTPMASAAASTSSSLDPVNQFEDYSNPADHFGRNLTESADVLNERLAADMNSEPWTMIPKTEPGDYQDDHMSDTCSRDGSAVGPGCGNGSNAAMSLMMGQHNHLMSAVTMNENSLGGGNESPAPNGAVASSYSASASPSLSTSSADGVDGVISYLKCLICERSFGQEGAADHMAQHVTDPQRCAICTEMPPFPSKAELIKHMVGHCARAYACRYCGKENPRVHYLKIHVRSHTGEKPYTCLQCGRGFADASTWRRHERVHTGEKPYECTICGRRIARRDNVKIHMRSHMRSKVQMSCRTCGKVFAQPNHLVLHERMCGGGAGNVDLKGGSSASTSSGDIPIVD